MQTVYVLLITIHNVTLGTVQPQQVVAVYTSAERCLQIANAPTPPGYTADSKCEPVKLVTDK